MCDLNPLSPRPLYDRHRLFNVLPKHAAIDNTYRDTLERWRDAPPMIADATDAADDPTLARLARQFWHAVIDRLSGNEGVAA